MFTKLQSQILAILIENPLGEKYGLLIKHFERMRKKRNIFFYEAEDAHNLTEAKKAAEVANELLNIVSNQINSLNPQRILKF